MDVINPVGSEAQDGLLKPSDITPNNDLVLIGLKVNNRRDGSQYAERYMTVANFLSTISDATQGNNLGTGEQVFKDKTGDTLNFRSIASGSSGIDVSTVGDTIEVSSAINIVVDCGKVYFIANVPGFGEMAVEATSFTPGTIPTPTCVNGLSFNIQPGGSTSPISAADLLSVIPPGVNTYDISKDGGMTWSTPNTNPSLTFIEFNCSELGLNVVQVRATNACGSDFCETAVDVQDNMANCP